MGSVPSGVVQACGALVVLLVLADVFFTVLLPASGRGPIRRPLSTLTWRGFAAVGRRLAVPRRRRLLTYSGPALITVTIATWLLLLVVGWSLVYLPALGGGVVASTGPTDTGWGTALYVSGFSLTTLGTGDVVPTSTPYRLLTVVEAAVGFSVFTMVLTYFLSIYGAITSRKTFGSSLHQQTFGSGSAAELLVGLADDDDLADARQQLSRLAEFLAHTFETHRSYPVLRYFHFRQERYALPRLLLVSLDGATLVRAALDGCRYRSLIRSAAVFGLVTAALQLLEELVPAAAATRPSPEEQRRWTARFEASVETLREAGLRVVTDRGEGAREYVALRARWDGPLRELSAAMLYDWDEMEAAVR